ncbi:MAG: 50S ribosomal protein L3 N(5)-glutamine methyltransferase [Pseudomonadota bacterium]
MTRMTPPNTLRPGDDVAKALQFTEARLAQSGVFFGHGTDNAADEAFALVATAAHLADGYDADLAGYKLTEDQVNRITQLLERRIEQRVPLPYLLGRARFAGLEFLCDERALVPRSPLAELILNDYQPWYAGPEPRRLLDLCCGGGSIGLSAAYYRPDLRVDLSDVSMDALALADENRLQWGLQDRVDIVRSDVFSQLSGRYDIILSNPPYVDAEDLAGMPQEYRHEPEQGLGAGLDGLDLARRILSQARSYLEDRGLLILEVGNSAEALMDVYPAVPFTWVELQNGGHGVLAMTAGELEAFFPEWS